KIMEAIGIAVWVDKESLINTVTAVSGSGPAYFFLLTECLSSVGEKIGLPSELANKLSRATAIGSGELLYQSDVSTENLRASVTSKGGTTEAALKVLLNENQLETLVEKAVQKAYQRSKELSS
ncbi:MAG: pyrroline-5-carboxylate reductase, partial [Rhodospirillaceae bacterium]|nr:pyrroline-5-carboxylate reductase [Rhodospirillaceae bacterium]